MPNWLHLPVAYHGRASSVVVSGTDVRRPRGQTQARDAPTPRRSARAGRSTSSWRRAVFVGPGNALGRADPGRRRGRDHLFGLVLLNDWSARDVQAWEYVPLGPFLAKNFATSISPWVVTLEALEPFRTAGPAQEPAPLPYLREDRPPAPSTSAWKSACKASRWTARDGLRRRTSSTCTGASAQQLAHHTVNGCNLRPGDLLASGTISGPTPDARGCLLELTWRGSQPLDLADGETRTFLQDGDRVTMTGWCQGDGYRVGFGEVTGRVLPAGD